MSRSYCYYFFAPRMHASLPEKTCKNPRKGSAKLRQLRWPPYKGVGPVWVDATKTFNFAGRQNAALCTALRSSINVH